MKNITELHQHLATQFGNYSIQELINLNNDLVGNQSWGRQRSMFRSAVLQALKGKGIDLSAIIIKQDGFTSIAMTPVKLTRENAIVPA